METKRVINLRGMSCSPELEEKFNTWYNGRHIPMLLKTGEIRSVTRYKRIGNDEQYPKYLAVYEFEDVKAFQRYEAHPELTAAIEDVKQTFPEEGPESKWRVQYEAIKTWER